MGFNDQVIGDTLFGDGGDTTTPVVSVETFPADALCGWRDCDICGFTYRIRSLIKLKDGSYVCSRDFDQEVR